MRIISKILSIFRGRTQPALRESALLREQLDMHAGNIGVSLSGNILSALTIGILMRNNVSLTTLFALLFALVSISAMRLVTIWRYRHTSFDEALARRLRRDIAWQALFNATVWGVGLMLLMRHAAPGEVVLMGMIASGLLGASAVTYGTMPAAAHSFTLTLSLFMIGAFTLADLPFSNTTSALLVCYMFVLMRTIDHGYTMFCVRLARECELDDTANTVKLLLNDFEQQGSDWLWEVNEAGLIVAPSVRFAEAACRPVEMLERCPLITLFNQCPEVAILHDHIRHFRSFRDLALPLTIDGELHWWSLSGRPVDSPVGGMRLRGVASDVSAAKNAEVKVAYMAHYDGLTELPNRVMFNEMLNHAINRRRKTAQLAVLSLDLDHFKSINDTLGHPAGDELLKIVSRKLEACIGKYDLVARLGGDEFAVLLTEGQTIESVTVLATRIIEMLGQPIDLGGNHALCGTSIGIAVIPDDGESVDELMKKVDLALYASKANGRNRFCFYEPGMDLAAQARREIELDLRAAMVRNELELHYQPLVMVENQKTVGYEALIRWNHPVKGLIMPDDFVPIAEETGLIVQLGEWVIRNAIAEAARWSEPLGISVNLSPAQMKSAGLISTIMNALSASGLAAERLELEITETVLMRESAANLATLHRLRALGVRIALDDFGTGYSSLNYLRSFPFDKIKIDRCFVRDLDQREDCQAIIRAITGLANSLGIITTAEGVESKEQFEKLRLDGCTQVQGFLYSKAVPACELTNLRPATPAITAPVAPQVLLPPTDKQQRVRKRA